MVYFLLVLLAPFDASIATETTEVDPVDECRVQRILVMCWADLLKMVDHLVIDHVTVIHLGFILFDCLEDDRNIVFWGLIRRWQLAVSMEVACRSEVVFDGGMLDVAPEDGLTSD